MENKAKRNKSENDTSLCSQKVSVDQNKVILKVTNIGVTGNLFLAVFKMYAGITGHSSAMISDAIHTISDIFATVIAWFGVRIGRKEADEKHPYGHERMECVASMVLGAILLITGLSLGLQGLRDILDGSAAAAEPPEFIAVLAAAVSIAAKEGMYHLTVYYADLIGSPAFRADAWHHRSDAFSSIGALIGIIGARMGYPVLDQIASLIICAVILYVAAGIIRDSIGNMIDTSCSEEYMKELKEFVEKEDGVLRLDLLQTRRFGEKVYVDLEFSADPDLTLMESHNIAERVHDDIEEQFKNVKHVMIHVNPYIKQDTQA